MGKHTIVHTLPAAFARTDWYTAYGIAMARCTVLRDQTCPDVHKNGGAVLPIADSKPLSGRHWAPMYRCRRRLLEPVQLSQAYSTARRHRNVLPDRDKNRRFNKHSRQRKQHTQSDRLSGKRRECSTVIASPFFFVADMPSKV